jgi:hypothetical protein
MRLSMLCLMLGVMTSLQGCIAVAEAVQAVAQVGTLYLTVKKEPIRVTTAECGIEPIYPDDGYQQRLTESEKDQIAAQAIRLQEICH